VLQIVVYGMRDGSMTQGDGATTFAQNNPDGLTAKEMVASYSLQKYFKMPSSATPTVWEVYNENRNFYGYCKDVNQVNGNYPAQFIIASSYGKGQVLYEGAVDSGFNKNPITNSDFNLPKNPYILLDSNEEIIKATVKIFDEKYKKATINDEGVVVSENKCFVIPHDEKYFVNAYGSNWINTLTPEYNGGTNSTQMWINIQNLLKTEKDRLWWAFRRYVGMAPTTIRDANSRCLIYKGLKNE
jgi:hypothetical protein